MPNPCPNMPFLAHFGSSKLPFPLFGYGSIPINTIFRGMNIHKPAILMFTRGTRFWHTAIFPLFVSWFLGTIGSLRPCPRSMSGPRATAWMTCPWQVFFPFNDVKQLGPKEKAGAPVPYSSFLCSAQHTAWHNEKVWFTATTHQMQRLLVTHRSGY